MMQAWAAYLDPLRSGSKSMGEQGRGRADSLSGDAVGVESSP